MKHKILATVTFLTGAFLSAIAAYYSIIGLNVIFPGSAIPVAGLELAKLVAVSWLYHNWSDAPKRILWPMSSMVIVLMLITSMGIFGFLSKAHLEQQAKLNSNITTELAVIDYQLETKNNAIKDLDKQVSNLDSAINKLTEKGQAKTALSETKKQKNDRESLTSKKETILKEIAPLTEKKITLESEMKKVEAEVGPIKYVAELLFGSTDAKLLDKSVRFVIILLIFVFDPLAIFLLLAFNISLSKKEVYGIEFVNIDLDTKTRRKKKETA